MMSYYCDVTCWKLGKASSVSGLTVVGSDVESCYIIHKSGIKDGKVGTARHTDSVWRVVVEKEEEEGGWDCSINLSPSPNTDSVSCVCCAGDVF